MVETQCLRTSVLALCQKGEVTKAAREEKNKLINNCQLNEKQAHV